jgi:hypothetical protein
MRRTPLMLACVAATIVIATSSAGATMRITGDRGGLLVSYAARFLEARVSGEKVVIDGPCYSACTLAIGILPRDQVCVTPKAVLGFHAAWRPNRTGAKIQAAEATRAMYDVYPPDVREWIDRRGGLTTHMILLRGQELATMVQSCTTPAAPAAATAHAGLNDQRNDSPVMREAPRRATYAARQAR